LLLREKKIEQSQKLLEDFASTHPSSSTRTRLSIAQMYLNQNNTSAVINTLQNIENLKNTPAVLGSLVYLCESIGNTDTALQVLDTSTKTLNKQADYYPTLLRKSADYKLKFGKYQDAAKIYKQLWELIGGGAKEMEILPLLVGRMRTAIQLLRENMPRELRRFQEVLERKQFQEENQKKIMEQN